jgi:hypothetical protein
MISTVVAFPVGFARRSAISSNEDPNIVHVLRILISSVGRNINAPQQMVAHGSESETGAVGGFFLTPVDKGCYAESK